jgi:hypothetical protein
VSSLDALTLAAMDERYPGAVWAVLRGCDAPEGMPVCRDYPSATIAADVLALAGYRPAKHAIPVPELDGPYDLTTVMKFSAGDGQDVVLVRRQ